MTRAMCLALALLLAACAQTQPDVGATVGSGGASARAGVDTGRVRGGVSTGGAYAAADVVDTGRTEVTVGTGGVGVATSIGRGPFRVGVSTGGWWMGI